MFGIGGFELFLILLFAFLIFGPDKLPDVAKTVGKGIAKFRGAQAVMTEQLKSVSSSIKESASSVSSSNQDTQTSDAVTSSKNIASSENAQVVHAEGFAERKARYERERAAKREEQKSTSEGK